MAELASSYCIVENLEPFSKLQNGHSVSSAAMPNPIFMVIAIAQASCGHSSLH